MRGSFSGGVSSAIQGGDVGLGILTGGVSAGFAEFAAPYLPNNGFVERLASRSVVGGITGGVSAELYGGSFGDGFRVGAKNAAYGFVFNHVWHEFGAPVFHRHGNNQPSWGSDNSEGLATRELPESGGTMAFSEMARDFGAYYLGVIGTAAGGIFAKEAYVSLMVAAGSPTGQYILQNDIPAVFDYIEGLLPGPPPPKPMGYLGSVTGELLGP